MKKILIAIVLSVFVIVLGGISIVFICDYHIQKREEYWQSVINSEFPIGATKTQLEEWVKQKHLALQWDPYRKDFWVFLEKIPTIFRNYSVSVEISFSDNIIIKEKMMTLGW